MNKNTSSSTGGIGFPGLLQVAFVVLKLCGVINWTWLWVLSPAWIAAIIVVVIFIILFIREWRYLK